MSEDDVIIHYTAVRMRVTGSGSLRMTMYSQDDIFSQPLTPITMSATTNIRPTRLMNFQHQRAMLEGKTTAIDETFRINKIIIFAKAVFAEYPG
jgi:hypothetical protein